MFNVLSYILYVLCIIGGLAFVFGLGFFWGYVWGIRADVIHKFGRW